MMIIVDRNLDRNFHFHLHASSRKRLPNLMKLRPVAISKELEAACPLLQYFRKVTDLSINTTVTPPQTPGYLKNQAFIFLVADQFQIPSR